MKQYATINNHKTSHQSIFRLLISSQARWLAHRFTAEDSPDGANRSVKQNLDEKKDHGIELLAAW